MFQKVTDGRYLGTYKTVNGFCFCPLVHGIPQTQCQQHMSVTSTCSFAHTVTTLRALEGVWYTSYTFTPQDSNNNPRQCLMQVD